VSLIFNHASKKDHQTNYRNPPGQRVILTGFDRSELTNAKVSKFGGVQWTPEQGNWFIPEEQFGLHSFFDGFKGEAFIDYSGLFTG
jgi:hypothetical protein